jgi:serine/threonine-protein kinase
VKVFEVGGHSARLPYIAMERLVGEDLAELLRKKRKLRFEEVISLVREVGAGLAAAHDAGIVHRDVKPRNVFHAQIPGASARVWKVLDFGVSKLIDNEASMTQDKVIGTPAYMAPEQAAGREVTPRSDVYALGVLAYRALTGRPAFTGDGMVETLSHVILAMPPPPSDAVRVNADVDLAFAIVMAKDPKERFASGAEFADALTRAAWGSLGPELRARGERVLAKNPWARVERVGTS